MFIRTKAYCIVALDIAYINVYWVSGLDIQPQRPAIVIIYWNSTVRSKMNNLFGYSVYSPYIIVTDRLVLYPNQVLN